jgi:UDP-N-acetylmuramyl pentapeptide phosphotransferase/UDP-N-acetylglucosamine-1-phosphate transferase
MMDFINDKYIVFIACLTAFVITYASIPSIVRVSHMKSLVDEPDNRKLHSKAIPTLGGLAIFAGITISSLLFIDSSVFPQINYIMAAIIVLFFVGIKDDILVIAPTTKLAGQIVAGALMILFTDIRLTHLHGFFGIQEIPEYVSFALTLFVMVVIINSVNLVDGIDGLASGVGIVASAFYGMWFFLTEHYSEATLSFAVIGAMLAFWRFNLFSVREKIFMGDTGALILGLVLSVLTIRFNEYNIKHDFTYAKWGAPAVSVALLIIPLFDTIRVMFIRVFLSRPIFKPDNRHIHHLFLKLGLSPGQALCVILLINVLFASALFCWHNVFGIRTWFLIIVIAAMLIFYIPVLLIRIKKHRKNA